MMKIFLIMFGACCGVFLHAYINDISYINALNNASYLVAGAVIVYFSYGCDKK
jgi:hypothetical protein